MPRAANQSPRVANICSWPNRARSGITTNIGKARSTKHGFYLVLPSPQAGGTARAPPSSWPPSPTNRSTVNSSYPRSWTQTHSSCECQPIRQEIQIKTRPFPSNGRSLPWNQLNLGRFPAAPPERERKGEGKSILGKRNKQKRDFGLVAEVQTIGWQIWVFYSAVEMFLGKGYP